MSVLFKDREDAGRRLGGLLDGYADRDDVIVLGIPRGGVGVAFEVAQALHAPLDVFLSRKLGVPGHEELAFGALAAGDGRFLQRQVIEAAGITEEEIERITETTCATLERQAKVFRAGRAPLKVADKTVILVDDGIATGASIFAAVKALRQMHPAKIVAAVPVMPASTYAWLGEAVDSLVCVAAPEHFYAVGMHYEKFSQVSDEEVQGLLKRAAIRDAGEADIAKKQCEVSISKRLMN